MLNNTDVGKVYDLIHTSDDLTGSLYTPVKITDLFKDADISGLFDNFMEVGYRSVTDSVVSANNNSALGALVSQNNSTDITISLGNIELHGVQDVNGLANAITAKLPNKIVQMVNKR